MDSQNEIIKLKDQMLSPAENILDCHIQKLSLKLRRGVSSDLDNFLSLKRLQLLSSTIYGWSFHEDIIPGNDESRPEGIRPLSWVG
jgi:hypothetical protein